MSRQKWFPIILLVDWLRINYCFSWKSLKKKVYCWCWTCYKMTGDCNNISEQSSKPVSTPNNNLHKLLNIRSLKEKKKKICCFHFGGKKMFLRFNWLVVGVNRLSHMRRSGQKIQLNRSFFQQQKQILTSAVLFLSEPIKTDSNSKGFLWKELKDVCVRGWVGVCVCVCGPTWTFAASVGCSCMRLHPEHWREERGISESRRWQKWAIYHFKTWQGCL